MTSGQPPRRMELTSLRLCNAAHGRCQNIFIKNGLVTFVTFCYKGYSITNSTKVISRYLAQEPNELLVYYMWLVLLSVGSSSCLRLIRKSRSHHTSGQRRGREGPHYRCLIKSQLGCLHIMITRAQSGPGVSSNHTSKSKGGVFCRKLLYIRNQP
jgi:hypothetical protein